MPLVRARSTPHAEWMKRNPLRIWRKRQRLSMLALAPMLDVSMLAIQLWENGDNRPNSMNMDKLKRLLQNQRLPYEWDAWYRERPNIKSALGG